MDGAKNNKKKPTEYTRREKMNQVQPMYSWQLIHSRNTKTSHSPPQPFASVDYYELPLLMPNIHMQP
jgi:hypothetical protein